MAPLRPSIAIAAVALSLLAVTTTAASAQENLVGRRDDGATTTGLGGRSYTYTVRDKKLANSNYVNKGQRIGDCTIETKGGTCTISSGMSAARTVLLALGASRDNISAQLSPSSTTTQSVTAGCTSPAMAAGKYGRLGLRETCGSIESTSVFTKGDPMEWITTAELAIS